ncbi:MAG TPA: hypothetical protein VM367_08250 [Pseudonocardia sp.]|nr:hypothetical protein [Pseudonocardia sp.]
MTGLVALSSGSAAETATLEHPRFRHLLDAVVYTGPGADTAALDGAAAVWVPEGTPRRRLRALAPALDAVLARGGTVLLFGDQQAGWPAGVEWTYRPAGGAGETVVPPGSAWAGTEVGAAAGRLHHHGVLTPPDGAEVLLAAPDDAPVVHLDRVSTPGALLVSTVDPLAHFGHTGSAEAGDYLDVLLPWVTEHLLTSGARR